jgi:anaerobic nitric oxide reductase transcription regulator
VPPLRERREDIPVLAAHFADAARRRLGLGPVRLSEEVLDHLRGADWPGNVRELENLVGRAVLRASGPGEAGERVRVDVAHLDLGSVARPLRPPADRAVPEPTDSSPRALRERVRDYERRLVGEALERHHGSWAAAARELGLHRSNLYHLAQRLGLGPSRSRIR